MKSRPLHVYTPQHLAVCHTWKMTRIYRICGKTGSPGCTRVVCPQRLWTCCLHWLRFKNAACQHGAWQLRGSTAEHLGLLAVASAWPLPFGCVSPLVPRGAHGFRTRDGQRGACGLIPRGPLPFDDAVNQGKEGAVLLRLHAGRGWRLRRGLWLLRRDRRRRLRLRQRLHLRQRRLGGRRQRVLSLPAGSNPHRSHRVPDPSSR